MWPFRKKIEERAEDTVTVLEAAFLNTKTSRDMALQIPTVEGCISRLAGDVSRLPIKLYKRESGKVSEVENDPRLRLLNDDTGDTLNANDFWKAMIQDYFLGKGAFAYINKSVGVIKSLHYVDDRSVSIYANTDPIFKDYNIRVLDREYYPFEFLRILRSTKNGWDSVPLTTQSPTIFSIAYQTMMLENSSMKGGGKKGGFLKATKQLANPAQVRKDFEAAYSSSEHKVIVLNENVDFKEATSSAVELQLNENKQTNNADICKLFGIPPAILSGGATQQDRSEYVNTVVNLINTIETSLDRDLLLESEKGSFYFAFDTKELTRGSIQERFNAYGVALQNNIMQIDEVRKLEDLPPTGFNYIKLGLQDVLLDQKSGMIYTPNTNAWAKMNGNKLNIGVDGDKIEPRANPYHDPATGRFTSGKSKGRSKKTKYTPSSRRNSGGITVKEEKYDILCGILNTQNPGLKSGEKRTIKDANYQYHVTADGFGGMTINRRSKIKNGGKKK